MKTNKEIDDLFEKCFDIDEAYTIDKIISIYEDITRG